MKTLGNAIQCSYDSTAGLVYNFATTFEHGTEISKLSVNTETWAYDVHFPSNIFENTPIQIYRKFHLQKLKIFK